MGAFHCRLEIDGLTGDSPDSPHPGGIDVLSFRWSEKQNVPAQSGLGGGVGRVHVTDLEVTALTGPASPRLMVACAAGQSFPAARLRCRRAASVGAEFLVMTFTGVLVSSYRVAGASDSPALPTDELALHFADITMEYRSMRQDGRLDGRPGGVVIGEWNVRDDHGGDPGRTPRPLVG